MAEARSPDLAQYAPQRNLIELPDQLRGIWPDSPQTRPRGGGSGEDGFE
jgi:hypothetical protein